MTETYDRIENDRNIKEARDEWESAIDFSQASNTYKLVRALLSEANRSDENLESIYEQHHINSATGNELDQLGNLVDVDRLSGESDDKYRARIKATFRASTIGTTYNEFAEFCASVLNTDVRNLLFTTNFNKNPASVAISARPQIYNSVNLTNQEVKDLLEKGVSAGHEVRVFEGGTFRLKSDGDGDDPDKGLTSDGISTGGTLAGDLI